MKKKCVKVVIFVYFGLPCGGWGFIINFPAAIVKAVVVGGWGYKNYICWISGIVFKNVRFPLKRMFVGGVNKIILLVDWCVQTDFIFSGL